MVKTRLLHLVLPRRYGFRKRKLIPPLSLFSRFVLHSFAKNLSLLLSRFRKEIRHLAVLLWVPWEQRESSQFMQKSCVLGGLIEHSASRVIQWESRFHEFPVFLVSYWCQPIWDDSRLPRHTNTNNWHTNSAKSSESVKFHAGHRKIRKVMRLSPGYIPRLVRVSLDTYLTLCYSIHAATVR